MNKKLTQTAVLAGICILLTLTPLGFIPTPFFKITFVHLPVILGTLLIGKKEGVALGLVFGLCSLYANIVTPNAISFAFYNPMVSIFPRVMIPVMVILVATALKNQKKEIRVLVSSAVGSLTNTVLVLSMIYIFYAARYAEAIHIEKSAVIGALAMTALTNGVAELILVSVLSLAVVKAMKKDLAF